MVCHCPIHLTAVLALMVHAHSAAGLAEAPIRRDLGPIAARIMHEDCRLLIVGDSNSLRETSPRMLGSMMRTWKPDAWVGRVSQGIPSIDNGVRLTTSDVGFDVVPRRMWNAALDDPEVWSNGQDAFVPNRGTDLRTTGSGLSGEAVYLSASLTKMQDYHGGDWSAGSPLKARLVFARSVDGMESMRFLARRGETAGSETTFSLLDADAPRPVIDWVDVDVPAGEGGVRTEVRSPVGWTSDGEGAAGPCPANCTAGESFYHVTQVLWRPDQPGLQIDALAEAGFAAWDHLAEANHYDDAALRGYLQATRDPNLFLVLLGQNTRAGEFEDVDGVWRSHIIGVIDRMRSASLANDPDADPMFLLVAPWQTQSEVSRFFDMARVMDEIAESRSDTGFINLMAISGSYAHNRGRTLEPQSVHFGSAEGADYFTSLLWDQIERAEAGMADHALPGSIGALSDVDFSSPGTNVWVMPGEWTGAADVTQGECTIVGWDQTESRLSAPSGEAVVHVHPQAFCDVRRLTIEGGDGHLHDDGLRRGGAVFVEAGELNLESCLLQGGETDVGGLLSVIDGEVAVSDSRFIDGGAAVGGIMHMEDSVLWVIDSTLIGGAAAGDGGALYQDGGAITFGAVRIMDCQAVDAGGAALVVQGDFNGVDLDIHGCDAEVGGGVAIASGDASLLACEIHSNNASSGGGVSITGGVVRIGGSTLCSNAANNITGPWVDLGGNEIIDQCVCPADLDASGAVDVQDLLLVIEAWGACPAPCPADLSGDGQVGTDDLLAIIAEWGVCI